MLLTLFQLGGGGSSSGDTTPDVYRMNIYEISPTGLVKWKDYIPVKEVIPSRTASFDFLGALSVHELSSVTGLVAWVHYKPVVRVTDGDESRWRFDNTGWIPIAIS